MRSDMFLVWLRQKSLEGEIYWQARQNSEKSIHVYYEAAMPYNTWDKMQHMGNNNGNN